MVLHIADNADNHSDYDDFISLLDLIGVASEGEVDIYLRVGSNNLLFANVYHNGEQASIYHTFGKWRVSCNRDGFFVSLFRSLGVDFTLDRWGLYFEL